MYFYDGQRYDSQADVPDLGSWECVQTDGGKRTYWGLSKDINKLPKYDDLRTGSKAVCLDTGSCYAYHAHTKEWYSM